jgi:hypothetical protein
MQSESARMSSAAEARFRVEAPNSLPRSIKVIALDRVAQPIVERLARAGWQHASFFAAIPPDTLRDTAGRTRSLREEVDAADLVVLVAGPGGQAHAAPEVGAACSLRRVMTTGFLVGTAAAPQSEVARTLAQLRPWSLMVVVAGSDEYLDDMMTALRA